MQLHEPAQRARRRIDERHCAFMLWNPCQEPLAWHVAVVFVEGDLVEDGVFASLAHIHTARGRERLLLSFPLIGGFQKDVPAVGI